ncbi:phage integrase N-terminal SAM-like domain-containing protein [Pseudomonas indica]|uniref:phage integrase N-terminal SAM-like domain-containing protein n=1 Tax=Pseudomonas indica TaxID=137658 RepID=UPI003F616662
MTTWLAVERKVAATTQNLALNALVFFYGKVLQQPLGQAARLRVKNVDFDVPRQRYPHGADLAGPCQRAHHADFQAFAGVQSPLG